MIRRLPVPAMQLLRQIVSKHEPDLLRLVGSIGSVPLTTEERESLREIVARELVETGLGPNDEPNDRGLLLEDLIDQLAHV